MPGISDEPRWFHVILTTYAAWLPGDPRGFRTRDHRDHVEGDYRNPPPTGQYDNLHRSAQESLTAPRRTFSVADRRVVLFLIHQKLTRLDLLTAILGVGGRHAHLLVKLRPKITRHQMGMVKRHVTFGLRERGDQNRVWAGGAKFIKVKDRKHQLNVYKYIADHVQEGFVIWKHGDAPPQADPGDAVAGL